jgi:uncharacterized protein YgbK (DUF1537 family)
VPSATGNNLLMAFVGDDFTGSTDAMESLARHGIRTVLFTNPPTAEQLRRYPGLRAFGIASLTRSLPTEQIAGYITPAFAALRASGAPIIHYKTCSTFDSSPTIGSIGRVIDVGMQAFSSEYVPVVVAAPALGRYCLFGNLFARCGSAPEIHRLDRHPSMSRHPTTPMNEADLRLHLQQQTAQSVGLLDILSLALPPEQLKERFKTTVQEGRRIVFIDALADGDLATIGRLLNSLSSDAHPLFVVGSSGIESALCAHWQHAGLVAQSTSFKPAEDAGPIIAICGSCSPVTGTQIQWAVEHGFVEFSLDPIDLQNGAFQNASPTPLPNPAGSPLVTPDPVIQKIAKLSADALLAGKSICIQTRGTQARDAHGQIIPDLGSHLGKLLSMILAKTPVRRVCIAGGDTSSQIARALQIESVEMIAELTRGSPLCKATSPNPRINGLEITFKGGQIGRPDFFGLVQKGQADSESDL